MRITTIRVSQLEAFWRSHRRARYATMDDIRREVHREHERHGRRISQLATHRMALLEQEFMARFPRHSLQILFGNGTYFASVDGRALHSMGTGRDPVLSYKPHDVWVNGGRPVPGLWFIVDAMNDIYEITNDFMDGCPDDVDIKGRGR